ncbi:hypothetical protein AOL_s00004g154 [Orbilia oligospora ATCC 24927]|uniref:Uncharacterized protein n=1 Tax=Arthrobotrys oligospora (strain ATCC 24927 / CBS 115.81 / DSM 1491) TaxID=756982 RepID=G1WXZ4_ARTOA|nr:hypothetical protein AOL_s00004g154 [Orbilia oligospora ATCC 24927]EGX54121.1 hypothetical protein AOL_s00004g154 [Orbilia oligospora ATCC 24927]
MLLPSVAPIPLIDQRYGPITKSIDHSGPPYGSIVHPLSRWGWRLSPPLFHFPPGGNEVDEKPEEVVFGDIEYCHYRENVPGNYILLLRHLLGTTARVMRRALGRLGFASVAMRGLEAMDINTVSAPYTLAT